MTPKIAMLNRPQRLKHASTWIATYCGKNKVRGYAKNYHVDLLCAIAELRMLGIPVTPEYENAIKLSINDRAIQKQKKKEAIKKWDDDQDEEFAFIAGYTSGGMPYGTRWDELW